MYNSKIQPLLQKRAILKKSMSPSAILKIAKGAAWVDFKK